MSKKIYSKKGFTLVETLVAISILLMAVVAPLTILAKNISAAFDAKNKVTALYLAEDAIDFVKYKIATKFNAGDPGWLDWPPANPSCPGDGDGGGPYCRVDSFADEIISCAGSDCVLLFDSTTGVYGYVSGSASKFTRTVTVANASQDPNPNTPSSDEVVITATVLWQDHGVDKKTTISEHAFAWR
ncbi:MAG: type II secretion system protein [bacterium]|nr:type II secretion system protein [bacterium]